jgi:plasmid stabilization system protein ParE
MPCRIIFEARVRLEFEGAFSCYNQRKAGLGDRFEEEVNAALQRILQDPDRFHLVGQTIRKAKVEVFDKYSVYFRVEPDFIGVVSVFHGARDPAELRRRLK